VVFPALSTPAGPAKAPSRPLTVDEVERLLSVADAGDRALLSHLAYMGVRDGSIPKLRYRDLEKDTVTAKLRAIDRSWLKKSG